MANKDKSLSGKLKDVGFLGELWQQIRLVFYLVKDREVPIYLKILPFLGIVYALFPIDLVTDFVPVLGQLDDLTLLLIGAKVFIEMAPPQVVARHMEQMRNQGTSTIVEGTAKDVVADVKLIEGNIVEEAPAFQPADPAQKKGLFRR